MAQQPLGSWVEVFRKTMLIAESEVGARELQAVTLGRDLRLANITSQRALRFGVTASLGADQQYADSQGFAAEAAQAGYDGVLYFVRHDPAQRLYGVALFGPEGQPDPADPLWPCNSGAIPDSLVQDAKDHFDYRVLPEP